MPELPEVETVRNQLKSVLVGQTILTVEVNKPKSFQGQIKDILGRQIRSIDRKGKMLYLELGADRTSVSYLMVHLKMTGQLIYQPHSHKHLRISDAAGTSP